MPLRIIFFGTAPLACASLTALAGSLDMQVLAVVTQPDRPKGRDLRLHPPAVKVEAAARQLPVLQPERARSPEFVNALSRLAPDLIIVAAYGQILPASILELPRYGCLNVHTSLLPKYRGAAPIQWAILNDEAEAGVTIMKMDAGLDTGDILSQRPTPIASSDDAQSLHDRLARMGAELLLQTIPDYVSGRISPRKQPDLGVTYARKITKEDGRLDWQQPARHLWNRVRALNPWPGAYTVLPGATKQSLLKVWQADVVDTVRGSPGVILDSNKSGIVVGCADAALRMLRVQREGGRPMTVQEFLAGFRLQRGESLGEAVQSAIRPRLT